MPAVAAVAMVSVYVAATWRTVGDLQQTDCRRVTISLSAVTLRLSDVTFSTAGNPPGKNQTLIQGRLNLGG